MDRDTLEALGVGVLYLAIFFAWEWIRRGPGSSPWGRRR
jgi:hypothetical protein